MTGKPTYEELEQRNKQLEQESLVLKKELGELKEQLKRSKIILSATPQLLVLKDSNSIYQAVNPAFCEFIGESDKDIIGKSDCDLFPRSEAEMYRSDDRKVMETGKPQVQDEEATGKDGTRWLQVIKTPIQGKNGKSIGLLCSVADMTERRQPEEGLRVLSSRQEALLAAIPDIIMEVDSNKIYTWANQPGMEFFGEDVIGNEAAFYFEGEQNTYNQVQPLFNGDENVIYVESWQRRKDREKRLLTWWCRVLKDTHGNVTGAISSARDITERIRAEDALRESEEKYRTVLEANPDPVIVYDMEGKVIYFNPAFTGVFGWTLEERLGEKMDVFVPEEAWRETKVMIEKVLAGERFSGVETRRYNKNRDIVPVSISGAIYRNQDGHPLGSVINLRDISEQKRLETQFQAAQKIEAIGTLAGGIAHDFNNLLMGIQGRTSLMLNDINSSDPHLEHLKGIEDYIKSATDLTKQLLGFARGGKYEVKPTNLNELVTKSAELFGRTKKEVSIHKKIQKNLRIVEVDRSQIEQVLLNLYVNAWQSMPGGGELYLETENVLLDDGFVKPYELKSGKYVKISVTDTGVGMDKATLERVFDPFFTTREMGRGTGLGLASAYGIIKNHGGIINVYSEKGKGAAFNIYLPASEKVVVKEKELSLDILKGVETILLVDDEEMIIDVGRELLKKLGYKVWAAKGGKAAVELYKANKDKIDMVILDMIMPHMGGGDTYDMLKAINPNVKVLLASGYSIDGQATEIIKRGCNGFIQKPFNMRDLSQKLRGILG